MKAVSLQPSPLFFLLLASVLIAVVNAYTITNDCFACLNEVSASNKFCLAAEDINTGYCCDVSDTNQACSSAYRYMCTDVAKTRSMMLYFCPNDPQKCFHTSPLQLYDKVFSGKTILLNDQTKQQGGTALDFGKDDNCGWHIISDSQYLSGKKLKVVIEQVKEAFCYINTGSDISNASNEKLCRQGDEFTFDADTQVFVIAQGTSEQAYMQFSYQVEDRITLTNVVIAYSFSVFGLLLLVAVVVILLVWMCIVCAIKKHQEAWQKQSVEMSKLVAQAKKTGIASPQAVNKNKGGFFGGKVVPSDNKDQPGNAEENEQVMKIAKSIWQNINKNGSNNT